MIAVIRQVCRNVKRWRGARMARRWTGTAMREAAKGFRRLKGHGRLSKLEAALERHRQKVTGEPAVAGIADAAERSCSGAARRFSAAKGTIPSLPKGVRLYPGRVRALAVIAARFDRWTQGDRWW